VKLRAALRMYLPHVLALIGIFALALGVTAYLVAHQRLRFPWQHVQVMYADFTNAQAVTPGQGQTVTVAGVKVGDIGAVNLKNGVARVEMDLTSSELGPVYSNAQLLLRPKTGLNDMSIEMDPGTPDRSLPHDGQLPTGATIPVSNTLPQVSLDEVLASLDADTRNYLVTLATAGGQGLGGHGPDIRRIFQASEPTLSETAQVMKAFSDRRREVARLVTNLRLLAHAAASKDAQLATLISASDAVFRTVSAHDAELATSLDRLPPALRALNGALGATRGLAADLGPAMRALEPAVRRLPSALVGVRPLLREATPLLRTRLRPLVRKTTPLVAELRPSLEQVNRADPDLVRTAGVVNYLANEVGYTPPGGHGYVFWLSWFMHDSGSMLSVEDAQGGVWRGLIMVSCSTLGQASTMFPELKPLATLPLCPPNTHSQRHAGGH
jgi:phospholipid/cholesterol/gamma-HCH transport system substrate-binding protein